MGVGYARPVPAKCPFRTPVLSALAPHALGAAAPAQSFSCCLSLKSWQSPCLIEPGVRLGDALADSRFLLRAAGGLQLRLPRG